MSLQLKNCSGISDGAGASIDVQIKAHLELGWSNIELRCIDGVNLTAIDDDKFDEVFKKVSDAGLQVSCFASAIANWARPVTTPFDVDVEELKRAVARMHRMKTKFIRIMSYPNDEKQPWDEIEWKTEVIRRLKELARIAEEGGVMLLHENCSGWGGKNYQNNLELLQEIDSPAFRALFDSGNPVVYGQDSWVWYQAVKDCIEYVHIKDAVLEDDKPQYTYCGEGDGQTKKILHDLAASGYDGIVSIEPHINQIIKCDESELGQKLYEHYVIYGAKLINLIENATNRNKTSLAEEEA
jgi:sugar phosphate isomerase/epimerase